MTIEARTVDNTMIAGWNTRIEVNGEVLCVVPLKKESKYAEKFIMYVLNNWNDIESQLKQEDPDEK